MSNKSRSYEYGMVPLLLTVMLAFWLVATFVDLAQAAERDRLVKAGARNAWQVSFPLRSIDTIKSYHLVDEYLYAIGTDGKVRAVRADIGKIAWTRPLAEPMETLYGPVTYHTSDMNAVVFTRLTDLLFLDPQRGDELKRYPFSSPTLSAAAMSEGSIFVTAVGSRIFKYDIEKEISTWRLSSAGPLRLPLLYGQDEDGEDLLYFADGTGMVACVRGDDKSKVFARQLDGEPRGRLVMDSKVLYAATSGGTLHFLDRLTGDPSRKSLQLSGPPAGGPVLSAHAVYQAVEAGGVYRVPLKPDSPVRFIRQARQYLADWPHHEVMLRTDGKIVLVSRLTGKVSSSVIDIGKLAGGVSNVRNQAVIVYSARGRIRCLLPLAAKPLTVADFKGAEAESSEKKSPTTKPSDEAAPLTK